ATLAFMGLYGWSFHLGPLAWGALVATALLYEVMIWARQDWRTGTRYATIACLLIALALAISLSDGGNPYATVLLVPLVLLLAREQQAHRRLAMGLAAGALAAMVGLSRLAPFAFTLLAGTLTLYVCIRAINVYKDAHCLGELHLRALD